MKNKIVFISVLSVFLLSIVNSCKKEDITIEVSDVVISMNEYIAGGTLENNAIIGAVEAITNEGSVQFSILEQTPDGAIKVNAISGLITVVNRNLFDFELNETMITKVKVENGDVSKEISITINLIDITSDNIYLTVTPEYTIAMDENPQAGDLVTELHAISNGGQVSLAILSQTPNNACELQGNQLLVADESVFDFESNATLNVLVLASINDLQEEITVQVSLNNLSPEFSQPEVLLENITAGELEYKDNLLYFISGYTIFSLNTTNPSEGMVEVLSANNASFISIFEDDIYFVSSPYYKKYNLLDESITTVSEYSGYYDLDNIWHYHTPGDLACIDDNIYFSSTQHSHNFIWSNIFRLKIADASFHNIEGSTVWASYSSFFLSDNYLFWVERYGETWDQYTIFRLDLNTVGSSELLIEPISSSINSTEAILGKLFIKGDFIYSTSANKIYKFDLTNTPSDIVQVFEFVDIYFGSVKLIGDTLYFANYANHTLSKIEINFDE